MTHSSKKNRIIFIDLMRAFAVLQMVQGHTTDVLLANQFRDTSNPIFAVWLFMRGMTAPIFMFTAGTVFTYLFRLVKDPFENNPRVFKGIKRFLLLVGLGYAIRYPTPSIIDFSQVSAESWKIFLAVDVLQLIGCSILFILFLAYIAEKLKLNDYYVFCAAGLLFFALSPFFEKISWIDLMPRFLAGYFYSGTGSLFPLFPWAGYVIFGAILGSFLAKNPMVFKSAKFSRNLGIAGIAALLLAFAAAEIYAATNYTQTYFDSFSLLFLRIGVVIILNSIVSYISLNVETIPRFLILVGRNTLLIYIVHLMILYGSAWNPGLKQLFGGSFSGWQTVGSALTMLLLMSALVLIIHKLKIRNKQLVTG